MTARPKPSSSIRRRGIAFTGSSNKDQCRGSVSLRALFSFLFNFVQSIIEQSSLLVPNLALHCAQIQKGNQYRKASESKTKKPISQEDDRAQSPLEHCLA